MNRGLLLARVLLAENGRAAVLRAAPFYLGLSIAAGVLFGGNGMDAADLIRVLRGSAVARLLFCGAWWLGTLPAASALLTTPTTFLLRALPVPRWHFAAVLGGLLLVAELPWIGLWARGAGVFAGVAAALVAAAGHAWIVARPRGAGEGAAGLAVGLLVAAGPALPDAATGALGLPLFVVGLRRALRRAPEGGPTRQPLVPRAPAPLSLALAYVASLLRGQSAQVARALLLCGVGALIAWLAVRNNHVRAGALGLSLALATPALLLGLFGLAGPVLRLERGAAWLLSAGAVGAPTQVLAVALALAGFGAVVGLLHGVLLGALLQEPPARCARLAGVAALGGVLLAAASGAALRSAVRGLPDDGDRVVLVGVVALPALSLSAWALGEAALALWAVLALFASLHAVHELAPPHRHERLRRERLLLRSGR